ncbi:MAG: alpha/beta fold hydrolase [Pseudomonadota bacterium]
MKSSISVLAKLMAMTLAMLTPEPTRANQIDACSPAPALHAPAEERPFSIETPDGVIEGTLAAPDAAPKALAVMLHGYTGARNEQRGMFRRAAHAFAERGIATLRIDFIGSGRSDGAWADTTFSSQARDAVRAATALRDEYKDRLPVSVLGFSQGGLVALHAGATGDPFHRMALWNPVMNPMATYGIIFGEETILQAATIHAQGGPNDIVGKTRLRPGFFAEIASADPIADAARVKAPVLIITGQRDPLVKNGATLAARIAAGRSEETSLLDMNAGHDLGAIREPDVLQNVITCTAGFLLKGG